MYSFELKGKEFGPLGKELGAFNPAMVALFAEHKQYKADKPQDILTA